MNKSCAWVVDMVHVKHTDKKIVRAMSPAGAIRTAVANSFMKNARKAACSVRLADPVRDLGAVKINKAVAS